MDDGEKLESVWRFDDRSEIEAAIEQINATLDAGLWSRGNLWDNGADAIVEFEHLLKVREYALSNFSEHNIKPGRCGAGPSGWEGGGAVPSGGVGMRGGPGETLYGVSVLTSIFIQSHIAP